jgi:HSP20 family protein
LGLSVSEDEKNVYVEAALPGIDPKDVEITLDKGILWIKGEAKEEEKQKKFYRKSARSFSYRVAVPGDINTKVEPNAVSKNGVMKVTFAKSPAAEPKKIAVKEEK